MIESTWIKGSLFFCVHGDVTNVCCRHFDGKAMGRKRLIPTDESLVGTLYLSENQMHPYWCVGLAGNVLHVS